MVQLVYQAFHFHDIFQGIIQKKSASGSQTLPFVIFDKKVPFFQKSRYFNIFLGNTLPKVPFFLKIPDAALKF